ncbi:MAG: ankyrin repeat domain-containing protein [Paracoccaceae bacterium]|nr:ankyrin repeat domain-containing protein [Paracoccaceae bacterium]MDE2675817.1 ankyrin repeat domain-containing protein [Paracoccaceae bacterium]
MALSDEEKYLIENILENKSLDHLGKCLFFFIHQPNLIEWILKHEVDLEPEINDHTHHTPLGYACWLKQPSENINMSIELLLAKGADPNARSISGKTPFDYSVRNKNEKISQLLLQSNGFDISECHEEGRHAMAKAACWGLYEIVGELLAKRVDPNRAFWDCESALTLAVTHNQYETLELLVNNGADVNLKNDQGETALSWATYLEKDGFVEKLKEAGATE